MNIGFVFALCTGTFIGNFAFKKFVSKINLKEAVTVSAISSAITGVFFIIIKLITEIL